MRPDLQTVQVVSEQPTFLEHDSLCRVMIKQAARMLQVSRKQSVCCGIDMSECEPSHDFNDGSLDMKRIGPHSGMPD